MLTRWTKLGLLAVTTVILATTATAGGDSPAPGFSLPARGGSTIDLSQFKGQVVMINFWASWCGPCRQEMPLLESMYKKYQPLGFTQGWMELQAASWQNSVTAAARPTIRRAMLMITPG